MASKDYAHVETDKELAELESRIAQVYADAAAEMKVTVDDYFDSYAKRYEQYLNEYNAGNITKEEFQQWELNQIGRGERYEAMQDALANRFVNADEVAMAYVNDATPSIYSLNRNYSNYSIDQYAKSLIGVEPDFILWDDSTVRNLIVNQPDLMPYYPEARAIQRGIDLAYGKSQITKAVTSGILQGKSLSKIARDLMNRIEGMSLNSALRAARTATTAAENAGRQDSYEEAADMGLKMEKVWLATLDSRTRVAHQQADMQVVGYDKTFNVGGESLMFPGDASHGASGWNLYNCRCTMFEKPEGMSMDDFERWARDPETGAREQVTGQSYEDWIKSKQGETEEEAPKSETLKYLESQTQIPYNQVGTLDHALTDQEIIDKLSGGDLTKGSCASLSLAYAGNKCGYDVTDYRGGSSQSYFSLLKNLKDISGLDGIKSTMTTGWKELKTAADAINTAEYDKEYIVATGSHAAIIKRTQGVGFQYLEMQSPYESENGWHKLTNETLVSRFKVHKTGRTFMGEKVNSTTIMMDVDSFKNNSEFQEILGYINTDTNAQMKGGSGNVR